MKMQPHFYGSLVMSEANPGTNGYIHAAAAKDQNARMVKFLTTKRLSQ